MSVQAPESPVAETPRWLEALEKKINRPRRLAHEVGAGSPCLICKEGCAGLNLHFWRKICIECKCRKEDHDVQEEDDYAQFEILFGAKKAKKTNLKFNSEVKTFDWLPQNIPQDLAVAYIKSLPSSKVPIVNTDGAKYRKQQLEKQLPLHDVDPSACHALSEQEKQEFQKYLNNLRNNVIGEGKIVQYGCLVNKITSEEKKSINPECASVQGLLAVDKLTGTKVSSYGIEHDLHPVGSVLEVTHPQQFHPEYEYPSGQACSSQPINLSRSAAVDLQHSEMSQKLLSNRKPNNSVNFNDSQYLPKGYAPSSFDNLNYVDSVNNVKNINERPTFDLKTPSSYINFKRPFEDKRNNNAETMSNSNDNQKIKSDETEIGENISEDDNVLLENKSRVPYQIPYDASLSLDGLNKFNELTVSGVDVPFVPLQESKNLIRKAANVLEPSTGILLNESNESFPNPPQICHQCLQVLNVSDIAIVTERAGDSHVWHSRCFVCDVCQELLVDLMYFYNKGKVYCGRHYAQIMKIPRCFACDELIFVKEYTCAEGESFHVRHFCCFHCDEPLGGKQYIPKDGNPVCLNCYQLKYGKSCKTCQNPIAANQERVSWKDLDFHATSNCFRCAKCLKSLLGGRFSFKDGNTFCSKECIKEYI